MDRRALLRSLVGGLAGATLQHAISQAEAVSADRSRLGLVQYCCNLTRQARRADGGPDLADPLNFLAYCREVGAGGMQVALGIRDEPYTTRLRSQAEQHELYIEGIADLPRSDAEVDRLDAEVRTAKLAGVEVVRVVMLPGRRYEQFRSAQEYREAAARGVLALQRAEPVAARHHVRLAVENHKDHRMDEKLAVLKQLGSEHVGLCVDTGNNLALLEDPLDTVRALAPWACSVHLKDHAVREYEDGFLLADVALGEGFLDLRQMVSILRKANPRIRFGLESITRDPLRVPCLTEPYWATLDAVPGRDLARTLRSIRAHASPRLVEPSQLPGPDQVALERNVVSTSLVYARQHLAM
jgi:sugar phosphate isomerase/epimerase